MDDDERHRQEEQERRAKRKASKISKSEAQLEKERKQKEHRDKILKQQGTSTSSSSSKKVELEKSAFQELFSQRAQAFQIDFRFRNAPPRPPVGPTFVGHTLDGVLNEECKQYRVNSVEVNYVWKLQNEADLGVPLAPSAMDLKSYQQQHQQQQVLSPLHPDDEALLDWQGPMGDTAADALKRRQEEARVAARAALTGKAPYKPMARLTQHSSSKKAFSRVLDEGMQTWMKKTTYLSNDYTRKVHDFKSLAQTKNELAQDLQVKQVEIAKRRSKRAIEQGFAEQTLQHPMKKNLKPKTVFVVLPNVQDWGRAYTHLVIDKAPNLPKPLEQKSLNQAFVGNVEKRQANSRMSCQVLVPVAKPDDDEEEGDPYQPAQSFDLDVIPLKDEDSPHVHFCLSVDRESGYATYLPLASRVQLSTGRPVKNGSLCHIRRRELTTSEQDEIEERAAEVDKDMAEKHHVVRRGEDKVTEDEPEMMEVDDKAEKNDDDDGEGDFGDDSSDSEAEALFGSGTKTIVAEG